MIASLVLLAALAGPADDVATLSKEVDALKKAVSDAASQRSVAELEARIERLSAELAQTRARNATDEDVRRSIDSLSAQVAELDRRVASLRVHNEDTASGFPASAHAGYDEGFTLRGNDDGLLLRINAYAQFRYEGIGVEDSRETANASDVSTFTLPRARLDLTGNAYFPQLTYRFLVDFTRSPSILDAWADWTPRPWISIRAGNFKPPFSRQRQADSNRLQMTERANATTEFAPRRELGVEAGTSLWDNRVHFAAAIQNGNPGPVNDNIDFAYAARFTIDPLGYIPDRDEGDAEYSESPLVSVGGSFLYNLLPTDAARIGLSPDVDGNGKLDNVAEWEAGAEMAARWRGASIQSELFYRNLDFGKAPPTVNQAGIDRQTTWGTYVQAGYFVVPRRLEIAARYSFAQPIDFGLDLTLRPTVPAENHEATFTITHLIVGRMIKIQAEYSFLEQDNVPELHGLSRSANRIRAQLQVGF
jgi:phosphate-selective porin OprO and OprP